MNDTETELKLQLDAAAVARLPRLKWLRNARLGKPETRRQSTVYYDTPDLRLRASQVSLRVRSVGSRRLQGVKTAPRPGSPTRGEWEFAIDGATPDLARLTDSDAAPLLSGVAPEDLRPVFRTDVRRTTYRLGGIDWQVEMAVDVGDIVAGQARSPISEVEFELIDGDPGHLYALAIDLAERLPLRLLLDSKSDRGYALLTGSCPAPSKWRSPPLPAKATATDAFRAVGGSCLAHLLANEACWRATGDAEAIHQMRVALRRLRSAITVFRPALAVDATAPVQVELTWLLRQLGPARDVDVVVQDVLAPVAAHLPEDEDLKHLVDELQARKERLYAEVQAALSAPRFTQLTLRLGRWIETGGGSDVRALSAGASPARDFARGVLARRDRKLRKAGRDLAGLPPDDRHRVRILVKKLRYAGEFFADLFPGKRSQRYLSALAVLQDRLGALNDRAMANRLLQGGDREVDGRRRQWAAGLVAGWHASRSGKMRTALSKAWSDYRQQTRFWH